MAYSSASSVSKLCKNILGPEKNFSFSTCPTITEVDTWLSSGCSIIETVLAAHTYVVPVASGTVAYGWLSDLNTLYGAAWVENARTNTTLEPGARSRGQYFLEEFWSQLDRLVSGKLGDLTLAGLSQISSGTLYAGGISVADKQTAETDSDRVSPRFARDMFRFDGTLDPSTGNTASPYS